MLIWDEIFCLTVLIWSSGKFWWYCIWYYWSSCIRSGCSFFLTCSSFWVSLYFCGFLLFGHWFVATLQASSPWSKQMVPSMKKNSAMRNWVCFCVYVGYFISSLLQIKPHISASLSATIAWLFRKYINVGYPDFNHKCMEGCVNICLDRILVVILSKMS